MIARSTCIRPAPAKIRVCGGCVPVRFDAISEAVDSKRSFIAEADSFVFPLACMIKATEPATYGAGRKARDDSEIGERMKGETNRTCWSLVRS